MDSLLQQNDKTDKWLWLKILVSGLIMFFLIERALIATGNINYVPSLLAVGTFTVPLAFLVLLYTRDKTPHVSLGTLLTCVLWGGILGTVLAGILEYQALIHLGTLPTFVVGVIEEAAKLLVPALLIIIRKDRNELDSIVIGAAAGAGFAAFESMGYGLVALLLFGGDLTAAIQVLLLRGLMAPAAHIAWTALITDALWHVTHRARQHAIWYFLCVFLGVVILHVLWDSITPLGIWMFVILSLISLGLLLFQVRKAAQIIPPANVDI
jgi:RsiW-degrading membrane proteinase PrsW (M82 family)